MLLLYTLLRQIHQIEENIYNEACKEVAIQCCLAIARILKTMISCMSLDLGDSESKIMKSMTSLTISANINDLNLYSSNKSYYGEILPLENMNDKFCLLHFLHPYYWYVLSNFSENNFVNLLFQREFINMYVNYNSNVRRDVCNRLEVKLEGAFKSFSKYVPGKNFLFKDFKEKLENTNFYTDQFTIGPIIIEYFLPNESNNYGKNYSQTSANFKTGSIKEQISKTKKSPTKKRFLELLSKLGKTDNPLGEEETKNFISSLHKELKSLRNNLIDFLKFNKQSKNERM